MGFESGDGTPRGRRIAAAIAVVLLHAWALNALMSLEIRPVEVAPRKPLEIVFIEPIRPPAPPPTPLQREPSSLPPPEPQPVPPPARVPPPKPVPPRAQAPRVKAPAPRPRPVPAPSKPARSRAPAEQPLRPPPPREETVPAPMPSVPKPPPVATAPPAPAAPPAPPLPPMPSPPVRSEIGLACPTQVAPQMPRRALLDGSEGVVRAQARIRGGRVLEVEILSGPPVFHQAVRSAMLQYRCVGSGDGEVLAVQEFQFRVE